MARNINAGTDRLSLNNGVVPGATACAAMRFRTTSATANAHLFSHCSSATRNGWMIGLNLAAGNLSFIAYGASAQRVGQTPAVVVNDGLWHNAVWNMNRGNGGANNFYIDGVAATPYNSTGDWNTATNYFPCVGDSFDTFWASAVFDVADVAYWTSQLTVDEIAAYAKGFSAHLIRPSALQYHLPLVRDITQLRTGLPVTVAGTTPVPGPPIFGGRI